MTNRRNQFSELYWEVKCKPPELVPNVPTVMLVNGFLWFLSKFLQFANGFLRFLFKFLQFANKFLGFPFGVPAVFEKFL